MPARSSGGFISLLRRGGAEHGRQGARKLREPGPGRLPRRPQAAFPGGLPRRPPGIARLSASVSAVGSCLGPAELRPWKGCGEFQGRAEAKKPSLTLRPRPPGFARAGAWVYLPPESRGPPRGLALAVPLLCQALVSPHLRGISCCSARVGSPCTDGNVEAQKGSATRPQSHRQYMLDLGREQGLCEPKA